MSRKFHVLGKFSETQKGTPSGHPNAPVFASVFEELLLEEFGDFFYGAGGADALGVDGQLGAVRAFEGEQSHDGLGVDLDAVLFEDDEAAVFRRGLIITPSSVIPNVCSH